MASTQRTSARFTAIETLRRLEKKRIPVGILFDKVLSEYPVQQNDRQLANNIIYGVLRNRESLDRMLQHLCKQPLKKLNPFVHQALRVGLFQIIHLDRIPDSAAVNESVKAVQAARLPKRLHGFVNGVLRNSIRKKTELQNLVNSLSPPLLEHPHWLVERWKKRFGSEKTTAICRQNNRQSTLILQSNSCNVQRDILLQTFTDNGTAAKKCEFSDSGIELPDYHGSITSLPGFEEGFFQVQDQGAQLLSRLLPPMHSGEEYLDACAGVGGKTSMLIQLSDAAGARVTAVEPDRARQIKFEKNMTRLHPELSVPLFPGTLQEFSAKSGKRFHAILLDAPCSGTGVIGRHPDIRWNRSKEDFKKYQETQLLLLQSAATLLVSGGILVYATCSLEEEENEWVVEQFLAKHHDFSLEDCSSLFQNEQQHLIRNGFFAPLPQQGMDGFFGARLRKN